MHGHQGLRFELIIGLNDCRTRWYSPTLQRFVSVDPVWATNLYQGYGNNPVNAVDPWGLIGIFVGGAGQKEGDTTKSIALLKTQYDEKT